LCADHARATTAGANATDTGQNASHHHSSSSSGAVSHAVSPGVAADADHGHHESAVSSTETLPDSDTLLNVPSGDCCSNLDSGPSSLAAARTDNGVLSTAHVAVFFNVPPINRSGRQPGAPTHAPPPGQLSPARTPLVLRV
jgi:hypothetical protein